TKARRKNSNYSSWCLGALVVVSKETARSFIGRGRVIRSIRCSRFLPLGELEPATGTALAVLFALLHAAVTGEISRVPQSAFEIIIVPRQRAPQAKHDGAGLPGRAAAVGFHEHVHLAA